MLKKIIIGILILTVFGAASAALAYNAAKPSDQTDSDTTPILAAGQGAPADRQAAQGVHGSQGAQGASQASRAHGAASNAAAPESMGEPWQAAGTITALDDYGFDFSVAGADSVYIELGPPDYWQSQGITLEVGQEVMVTGSINADMIHASQVLLDGGQMLEIRTASGQPLWSGGAGVGQGGEGAGSQVPVDEWITIEGTLLSFQGGNMTMGTADGDLIAFQTGQPRFFAGQGVTFQVGNEIIVVGYNEGDQFMAGDITQVSTGLRVMLRDPNGRPLWSGPGNSNGQGAQGNGNGNRYGRGGE